MRLLSIIIFAIIQLPIKLKRVNMLNNKIVTISSIGKQEFDLCDSDIQLFNELLKRFSKKNAK